MKLSQKVQKLSRSLVDTLRQGTKKTTVRTKILYKRFLALPDTQRRSIIFASLISSVLVTWLITTLMLTPAEKCIKSNGKWLERYSECENVSEKVCKQIDGTYNSCASSCRNSKFSVCLQKCIKVCKVED